MKTERKPGERKLDLSSETTVELLKKTKPLIRTDWGGQPALKVIRNDLRKMHANSNLTTCRAVKKIAEEQMSGSRQRAFPRIDEAINRQS